MNTGVESDKNGIQRTVSLQQYIVPQKDLKFYWTKKLKILNFFKRFIVVSSFKFGFENFDFLLLSWNLESIFCVVWCNFLSERSYIEKFDFCYFWSNLRWQKPKGLTHHCKEGSVLSLEKRASVEWVPETRWFRNEASNAMSDIIDCSWGKFHASSNLTIDMCEMLSKASSTSIQAQRPISVAFNDSSVLSIRQCKFSG